MTQNLELPFVLLEEDPGPVRGLMRISASFLRSGDTGQLVHFLDPSGSEFQVSAPKFRSKYPLRWQFSGSGPLF